MATARQAAAAHSAVVGPGHMLALLPWIPVAPSCLQRRSRSKIPLHIFFIHLKFLFTHTQLHAPSPPHTTTHTYTHTHSLHPPFYPPPMCIKPHAKSRERGEMGR